MCLRMCLVVHALCGVAYTGAGSVLMVAGIFFFISSPLLQLGSNVLTGGLCIVFGVGSVLLSCCGSDSGGSGRTDKLLGCTAIVLAAAVGNLVVLEVGEWWLLYNDNLKYVIQLHQMDELVFYGHLVPSLTTCAVMLVAFLDAQFLYCICNMRQTPNVRHIRVNEPVSDIEYIIPRHKHRSMSSKQAQSLTQYTQSWVFDTEGSSQTDSPYLKLAHASSELPRRHHQPGSPAISVQVDSGSEAGSEVRHMTHMTSFSRTHSGAHSPALSSPSLAPSPSPPVYQLPHLRADKQPHASLIAELRAVSRKHVDPDPNPDFSLELEAALQLIQDLESPSVDTPVDPCPDTNGKPSHLAVESQSTSGYNSPSTCTSVREVPDSMCIIRQVDGATVVSILPGGVQSEPGTGPPRRRTHARTLSEGRLKVAMGRMRELLHVHRTPTTSLMNGLPDLESAVLKSESLAWCTEGELQERVDLTRDLHRRIEAKVKRDLGYGGWNSKTEDTNNVI